MESKKVNTLRWVRKHFDKDQKQVAAGINTTVSNYSRYENKEFLPDENVLKKLALYYSCSVEFIKNYEAPTSVHVNTANNSVVAGTIHTNHQNNLPEGFKEFSQAILQQVQATNELLNVYLKKMVL